MKIHIVQKGDTIWEIANKYGVNFEDVKSVNPQLSSPDMIMPGMKIKIPGTSKPVAKEKQKKKAGKTLYKDLSPPPKPVSQQPGVKPKEVQLKMPELPKEKEMMKMPVMETDYPKKESFKKPKMQVKPSLHQSLPEIPKEKALSKTKIEKKAVKPAQKKPTPLPEMPMYTEPAFMYQPAYTQPYPCPCQVPMYHHPCHSYWMGTGGFDGMTPYPYSGQYAQPMGYFGNQQPMQPTDMSMVPTFMTHNHDRSNIPLSSNTAKEKGNPSGVHGDDFQPKPPQQPNLPNMDS